MKIIVDAMGGDNAPQEIVKGAGTQFDPQIVQAFVDASDEVREVSENFHDDSVT